MDYEVIDYKNIEDAIEVGKKMNYCLIHYLSEVVFKRANEINDVNLDECIEARFFNENEEIRIFRNNGVFVAKHIKDAKTECNSNVLYYNIEDRFREIGARVGVKEYYKKDDDGQAIIVLTRLCKVES